MDDLISKLSEIRSDYNCFSADEEPYYRALSEAIKILSQLADGDTISRQAAIDALARMMPHSYTPDGSHPADEEIFRVQEIFADCIEALEILPSAQPEIIRCKDCKHRDKYGCCKYWKGLAMGDIPIATDDYDFCSYAKRI